MSPRGEQIRLEPGHHLDRYELLCPIARGGMAWVWLACLRGKWGFEKLVAVKTILPQYASDPDCQRMFLDEARIASGIEHANVARILDLGESNEMLYLVMEWIDGDSLVKLQRAVESHKDSIPIGIALRIIADVSAGLHAAHELRDRAGAYLGVVHRDVSPQNVLVSIDGVAKLIDFGIVTVRDRVSEELRAGMPKGKLAYMAPEQAAGRWVDRRSDVWALGAMTHYLLTGAPPFRPANELQARRRWKIGHAPPSLPSNYPAELDALCQKALSFDPETRMSTAADFRYGVETLMIDTRYYAAASDVSAFVKHHLADRMEARHLAVQRALRAAAERGSRDSVAGLATSMIVPSSVVPSSVFPTSVVPSSAVPSRSAPPPSSDGDPADALDGTTDPGIDESTRRFRRPRARCPMSLGFYLALEAESPRKQLLAAAFGVLMALLFAALLALVSFLER